MSRIIYLSIFIFASKFAIAQDSVVKQNEHSLSINYGLNQHKENNLFSKVHKGSLLLLGYKYSFSGKSITEVEYTAGYSLLSHPFETKRESFAILSNLQFRKLFRLKSTPNLYLGGKLGYYHQLSYYPYWEEQHVYWGTSGNLAIATKYQIEHNNKKHIFSLQVPIMALVSRPDANRLTVADNLNFSGVLSQMHSDFELGTFNKHLGFFSTYDFIFPIGTKQFGILAYLNYQRLKTKNAKSFQQLQYLIGTKIIF